MLKRFIYRIKVALARRVGPVMVVGFRNADGTKRSKTRYGSTTYFQGLERLHLGESVYIAQHCFIDGSNGLHVGEGCQVCSFSSLLTHSSHISIRLYGASYAGADMKGYQKGSVRIGDYTFVGPNVVIMPDTQIGKGSIVAAYSYVKGSFPDYAIIAGNPAVAVGDTRKLDAPFLLQYPELRSTYEQWAGALPPEVSAHAHDQ